MRKINPSEHGFKVIMENVGSESDLANISIDNKINSKAKEKKLIGAHDMESTKEDIFLDELANDRDNIVKLTKDDVLRKGSEWKMAEEQKKEPEYPFGDGELIYAFYGNDARNVITFFLRMPDNSVQNHTIDKTEQHGPAWYWVKKTFTEDDLHKATKREIDKINKFRKREEDEMKEQKTKHDQEMLFQAKIDAFEIPAVAESTSRALKSAIRKSKSIMEVTATVGAIIAISEMTKSEENTNVSE